MTALMIMFIVISVSESMIIAGRMVTQQGFYVRPNIASRPAAPVRVRGTIHMIRQNIKQLQR